MTSTPGISIRRKLSLITTLTSSLGLLIACGAFLTHDHLSFRRSMVQGLSGLAEIIGSSCVSALLAEDSQAAGEALVRVSANPHVVSAFVYSSSGELLGGYSAAAAGHEVVPPPAESESHRFEDGHLVLYRKIFREGVPVGTIRLKSDMLELQARTRRFAEVAFLVLALTLFVTVMISARVQRVVSAPILMLADAARSITTKKDYSIRVSRRANDEVGLLTDSFNEMLDRIQEREGDLRTAHRKLQRYAVLQTQEAQHQAKSREQAEKALQESEEQLRQSQKMEAIGRLAGGVAHDFNNLLTIITGYSDLIVGQLDAEDPLRRQTEEIREASDRAASLTRQLLAFSRKQVLKPEVLNLDTIVSDMQKMLRRVIGEDILLETHAGAELGNIKADPGQIEQVILNLAVNARDAMPDGGKLVIRTENADDRAVSLSVADTGCGMDEATRANIFEPFFTTKEEGKGTGLGLSTVYGIVKQSGGTIEVQSEPGRGTAFRILFPRVELAVEPRRARPDGLAVANGNETVLVVEDEPAVRSLAQGILERSGYKVLSAPHGGDALLICERHDGPIDLMVTDVVMPHMSGLDLHQRLRPLRPEMKVLYMSGHIELPMLRKGVLDPDLPFLHKPFTPHGLTRTVRDVLDGKHGLITLAGTLA